MLDLFANRSLEFEPVGSRVTCNPPPEDTDMDYLCLLDRGSDDAKRFVEILRVNGFNNESNTDVYARISDKTGPEGFESWRMGDVNLIVTYSRTFFDRFMEASASCKEKNLLKKEDRITEFERIMYSDDVLKTKKEPENPNGLGQYVFDTRAWAQRAQRVFRQEVEIQARPVQRLIDWEDLFPARPVEQALQVTPRRDQTPPPPVIPTPQDRLRQRNAALAQNRQTWFDRRG
jgi:hypothetical protein